MLAPEVGAPRPGPEVGAAELGAKLASILEAMSREFWDEVLIELGAELGSDLGGDPDRQGGVRLSSRVALACKSGDEFYSGISSCAVVEGSDSYYIDDGD